jgi:hypothetical protein
MPAHKAAKMPDAKLGEENEPPKNPIVPPKIVDMLPMYGPNSIPINGAVIEAAVMVLPGKPIIGEIGRNDKSVYNAVKQMVKAISLVFSL